LLREHVPRKPFLEFGVMGTFVLFTMVSCGVKEEPTDNYDYEVVVPVNLPKGPKSVVSTRGTFSSTSVQPAPKKKPQGRKSPEPKEPEKRTREGKGKYDSMSLSEKMRHMQRVIFPRMNNVFRSYFPTKYGRPGSFHCQTCHGEPRTKGWTDFSRPSKLYPLDPKNMPTANTNNTYRNNVVLRMQKILREMRVLVGRPGMTCFGCHAKK